MNKLTQAIALGLLITLITIIVDNKAEIKSLQVKLVELGEVCQTASMVESPIVILAPEYTEEEK